MSIRIYQFVQYPPYNPGMNTHRVGDDSFVIIFILVSLSLLFVAALVGYSLKDCSKAVKDYRSRVEQVFDKKKFELDLSCHSGNLQKVAKGRSHWGKSLIAFDFQHNGSVFRHRVPPPAVPSRS